MGPTFIAEYKTDCARCDDPLEPGQVGRMGFDGAEHVRCPRTPKERPACTDCGLVHGSAQKECDW